MPAPARSRCSRRACRSQEWSAPSSTAPRWPAQNWLSVYWKTGAFGENIGYSNPEFDALVDEADTTVDPARRAKLYAQAQTLLTDGAPVAFGWNSQNDFLVKPWVKGIVTTPQDYGFAGIVMPLTIDIDQSMLPE